MDPQTVKGEYDERCDYYSYCCMSYEVLSGEWLPRITLRDLWRMKENRRPSFPPCIPLELRTVLLSGFEEKLERRASWNDTIEALSKFEN